MTFHPNVSSKNLHTVSKANFDTEELTGTAFTSFGQSDNGNIHKSVSPKAANDFYNREIKWVENRSIKRRE